MVITRFAPSPTGNLHIGGARTALFNFLFSKNQNGKFYLRIEDTDYERSKEEFLIQIKSTLKWLNIGWDGEPFIQSKSLN
ncbi:MAG: glutamate--tRNA ligase family protein, partial [Candidatus Fonsibacter sp.]